MFSKIDVLWADYGNQQPKEQEVAQRAVLATCAAQSISLQRGRGKDGSTSTPGGALVSFHQLVIPAIL